MAKGIFGKADSIKNGLIFGGLFGAVLLLAAQNTAAISFIADGATSLVTWMTTQWPSLTFASQAVWEYTVAIFIGMVAGAMIDSR